MHIGARRVFRLSITTSLSLAAGYALAPDIPFLAPLFEFMLTAAPKPPMGPRALLGLLIVLAIMLSSGLILTPILLHYAVTGLLLVASSLFLANYISLNLGKPPVGSLLTMGVTLIAMMGQLSFDLAVTVMQELMIAIAVAVVCQWVVYPFFPEEDVPPPESPAPQKPQPQQFSWLAARATMTVFPVFLLGLTDPSFYAPIIMKSVALGQQTSATNARNAGWELLGSTFLAGIFAILFWFCLKLTPNLWMFTLWTLAFTTWMSAKFFGILPSRFSPTFWQNVVVTLFILVGPAVADSANGKDPYKAFAVRLSLFVGVTLYAWLSLVFLEWLRERQLRKHDFLTLEAN
ncbi:MAG: DUF2955 domain-containing protein [Gammaproteobacteria bacterium]|nr:DUF2955 domain-containing protein [Gammaproteobacteria bacterium]